MSAAESPNNTLLRAILIQQLRLGQVLCSARELCDSGKLPGENHSLLLREHIGRLDALIYAFSITCPNYRSLCEVVGIGEREIKESLDRIGADMEALNFLAGDLAMHRVKMAEGEA